MISGGYGVTIEELIISLLQLFVLKLKARNVIRPRLFQSPAAAAAAASVAAAYALTNNNTEKNNDLVDVKGADLKLNQHKSPSGVVIDTDEFATGRKFLESRLEEIINQNSKLKERLVEMNSSHAQLLMVTLCIPNY